MSHQPSCRPSPWVKQVNGVSEDKPLDGIQDDRIISSCWTIFILLSNRCRLHKTVTGLAALIIKVKNCKYFHFSPNRYARDCLSPKAVFGCLLPFSPSRSHLFLLMCQLALLCLLVKLFCCCWDIEYRLEKRKQVPTAAVQVGRFTVTVFFLLVEHFCPDLTWMLLLLLLLISFIFLSMWQTTTWPAFFPLQLSSATRRTFVLLTVPILWLRCDA